MNYIGIDIGTSSISSVVYNQPTGKVESFTFPNNTSVISEATWEKAQDPQQILKIVEDILSDFFEKYTDIGGIGISGQMHGMLYTNNNGDAVSPLYTWQDGRGNLLYKEGITYAEYLSEATEHNVSTGYGLVTHFYNTNNALLPDEAVYICTIMDYVVMKLTGRKKPVTDHSNAASLGFFDIENLDFDRRALYIAGIETSILPELMDAKSCCGYYRNTPVFPAIGDNQAAFAGSVADKNKSIHITVGTSSQISVFSDSYIKIPGLDTRPFPGGGYLLVGAALCGGQAFATLKVFFEKTLKMLSVKEAGDIDIYNFMTSVPYKDNTQDIPEVSTLFDGTRSAPLERGTINNISTSNFTPENLVIGFLKGISDELYGFYNNIPDNIKNEKKSITGSGNALKKNPLLCKAFEEQFNLGLEFSQSGEEAAFGACLLSLNTLL